MKKLATLFFLMILFLSPFAIAEEGPTDTTQPSPPPTEAPPTTSPPPAETPTTQPQQPTETTIPSSSGGGGGGEGSPPPQPQPPQEQPREEHKEGCPQPPSPSCNPDQRAEPFYKDGCISGYNCVSSGFQEGPRDRPPESRCPSDKACMKGEECVPCPGQGQPGFQNIPPGCHVEQGEFGQFIKCEQDKRFEDEKRRGEEDCRQHNGKFLIRGDGSWECVAQGQQGFFNQGSCPSKEELHNIELKCRESNGKFEWFRDRNGCEAVSCRQEFSQGQGPGSEEEKIKFMALGCEEQGGQFTFNEQGPKCVGGQQQIRINRDLKPLEGIELLKIALEMENIIQVFNEITEKLTRLQQYYQSKGDEEKAKAFEIALSQLDGAMKRLDEIRIGLAENADSLQEEDRYAVLGDMQQINSIIKDVAVTLLTGGKSKRAATGRFEREPKEREFKGGEFEGEEFEGPEGIPPEEGFDILQGFQNCADFSEDDPFKFSPEPGITVKLEGLKDEKCVMKVKPPEMPGEITLLPGEITLLLPPEVYQFFDGPHLLLRDDVECSPDFACKMMKQQIQSEGQGRGGERRPQPPKERFGEKERKEKYGIEFGKLGCNNPGSEPELIQECKQQGEIACEIEVPGCGNWVVCESSQDKCPPRDYCRVKPEACSQEKEFEDFEGPEFPEPRRTLEKPKSGELRPSQCDDAELNNEECAKWAIDTNTLEKIPQCKGLSQEQCIKLLKNSWDRSFENKGFEQPRKESPRQFSQYQSYPQDFQQPQQYQQQYNYPQSPQQGFKQPFQSNPSVGFCGDGSIAPSLGEECDDRNTKDGDGCSASCKVEQKPIAVANVIKSFGNWMRGE